MIKTLTTFLKLLGYPIVTAVFLLMLAGPGIFLKSLGQRNTILAYILAYLFAFYTPAIVAGFDTGFNKGTMFSNKTLIYGVWSAGILAIFHLISFFFSINVLGSFWIIVFLFAAVLVSRDRGGQ